jgi:Fur family ferric uptake transcriptional regulator
MIKMVKMHTHEHKIKLENLYSQLRKNDLKITSPRKLVLEALLKDHGPFSAEELLTKLKKKCDLASVYRTLTSLEEVHIIRRCEFGDKISRYELINLNNDHHHHHLICNKCKTIEVINTCRLEKSIKSTIKKSGFKNVSHILEFFGTCPSCQY